MNMQSPPSETGERHPHPVDVFVGNRIRLRRKEMGISQERLGAEIGLTFQQVQKYEHGTNRCSPSRLAAIAQVLKAPIVYFFPPDLNSIARPAEPNPLAQEMRSVMRRMSSLLAEGEALLGVTTKH